MDSRYGMSVKLLPVIPSPRGNPHVHSVPGPPGELFGPEIRKPFFGREDFFDASEFLIFRFLVRSVLKRRSRDFCAPEGKEFRGDFLSAREHASEKENRQMKRERKT